MNTTTTTPQINAANLLYSFAHQRPSLSFADYGDRKIYRNESAEITRDLHDFRELYALASDILGGEELAKRIAEFLTTSSDRLTLEGDRLRYITGQYFPTEYRPASSRVLSSIVWREFAKRYETGDEIRKAIRRRVSRRVARLYFS